MKKQKTVNRLKINQFIVTVATVSVFVMNFFAFAQQNPPTENAKPLELPAFIIEGVEQHNIKSSIKQMPSRSKILNQNELDSLNSFEKQQPTLIPADRLPEHYITKPYSKGFVKASYGLFNTPDFEAGYGFYLDKFDIFANAGATVSSGDAQNSEYSKFFIDVNANYIADDKFFIFGGSSTRTGILINSQNFNFYGYDKRPINTNYYDRNLTQAKFYVNSDGAFENLLFNVGGSANIIQTSNHTQARRYTIGNNLDNYFINGFLTVKNYWKNVLLSGNIALNFEDVAGNSLNYYQFDAALSYFNPTVSLLLKAGFQIANNSADISRGGLLLLGNIEYRMSKLFTVKAEVSSGLEKTNFENIIKLNPYLSARTFIDHRYNIFAAKGALLFHPNEEISLSAGVDIRYADRNLNFINDSLSQFKLDYVNGSVNTVFGELFWNISNNNRLIGKADINIYKLADNKNMTYLPPFQISGTYYRQWINLATNYVNELGFYADNSNDFSLGTYFTVSFVGERKVEAVRNNTVAAYLSLNAGIDLTYRKLSLLIAANNLTNSNIYLFEGYRERGLFASVGLMYRF